MNKNEEKQFNMLKFYLNQCLTFPNEKDIFYKNKKISKTSEPYDALVELENGKKIFVQLTQMNNVVGQNKKGKIHDPTLMGSNPAFNSKSSQKEIVKLEKKGIKRKYFKQNAYEESYVDTFKTLQDGEEDLDQKYNVNSGHLINALVRTFRSKFKYDLKDKKSKSVLVIFDMSLNPIYRLYLKEEQKNVDEEINIGNFFISIFNAALNEIGKSNFFDYIQIYFRETNEHLEATPIILVNNKMENKFKLPNKKMSLFKGITAKNKYKTFLKIPK